MGKGKQLHGHSCPPLQETGPVTTQGLSQWQARLELMCLSRESGSALELFPKWTDIYVLNNDRNGGITQSRTFKKKKKILLQHTNIIYEALWIIRIMKCLTYRWGASFCLTRISLGLKGRKTAMSKPRVNRELPQLNEIQQPKRVDLGEICHTPHLLLIYKPNSHGIFVNSMWETKIHFLQGGMLVKVK